MQLCWMQVKMGSPSRTGPENPPSPGVLPEARCNPEVVVCHYFGFQPPQAYPTLARKITDHEQLHLWEQTNGIDGGRTHGPMAGSWGPSQIATVLSPASAGAPLPPANTAGYSSLNISPRCLTYSDSPGGVSTPGSGGTQIATPLEDQPR